MKKLVLVLAIVAFASISILGQAESRIVRLENISENANRYLEITSFKIVDTEIFFNEKFVANANWLKDINIKIKNTSGKSINCLWLSLGLLEEINDKHYEPWKHEIGFYRGNCFSAKDKDKNEFLLEDGKSVTLTSANIPRVFEKYINKTTKYNFHQAKFAYSAIVFFQGEQAEYGSSYFSSPNNIRVFEEH